MATGTALEAEMRKTAPCARRASIPARVAAGLVTLPLRDVTTRRSAQMDQMRKTASIVNPETFTAEPTCASLRRGGATVRRTVWMAVMKETVWPLCPGRWSQQLWSAVWCVGSCWSSHWVVPLNCTRSGPESTGEIISFIFLYIFFLYNFISLYIYHFPSFLFTSLHFSIHHFHFICWFFLLSIATDGFNINSLVFCLHIYIFFTLISLLCTRCLCLACVSLSAPLIFSPHSYCPP